MADIEISENSEQCIGSQHRLTVCVDEIKRIYTDILKYATSTETSWWQGKKHDDFVKEIEMRKEQFNMFERKIQCEKQFFEHWKETTGKLDNIFETLLNLLGRLD